MRLEDLGLVGNCQISALIDRGGSVVWCCLPRFDSEPVFSSLLDAEAGGRFDVGPEGGGAGEQRYIENTNVLETRFETKAGSFRFCSLVSSERSADLPLGSPMLPVAPPATAMG